MRVSNVANICIDKVFFEEVIEKKIFKGSFYTDNISYFAKRNLCCHYKMMYFIEVQTYYFDFEPGGRM